MPVQQPSQPLQCFAVLGGSLPPLLLADLVDGAVEGFNDMEAIQHKRGVRAMILNGAHVGLAHIAAGQLDLRLLVIAEHLIEENVNGFAPFAGTDPDHTGPIQVVDQRGVLVPLGIGDLVDADSSQPPDLVAVTGGCDAAMQQVRERRGGGVQQRSGPLLSHHLAVT